MPKQNGPFRFDFYADHDLSGGYSDPRPDIFLDHAWRLSLDDDLLDDTGTYVISFDHNQSFTNLNTPSPPTEFGKPATVHLKAMGAFANKRVEVRISDASTNRSVAMFRVPVLKDVELDAVVSGMIETGVTYAVEIYTDNGSGGDVRAFRFQELARDPGLEATFNGDRPTETPGVAQVSDARPPE